jgi:hypothetical protein
MLIKNLKINFRAMRKTPFEKMGYIFLMCWKHTVIYEILKKFDFFANIGLNIFFLLLFA